MKEHLVLRSATPDDADRVFAWRNDPLTRRQSIARDALVYEEHVVWFARALANPARVLAIGLSGSAAVGLIRLDFAPHAAELSWMVAPEARGQGHGGQMVRAMTALFGIVPMAATVRSENVFSRRIAEAAGFLLERDAEGLCRYRRSSTDPSRRSQGDSLL